MSSTRWLVHAARKATRLAALTLGGVHYRLLGYPCRSDVWGFSLHVRRSDVVLEVGAGGNPRIRSDILLEKYFDDRSEQRSAKEVDERPYVIGDGCNIPLRDNAVDYIICCHVLEHVDDPTSMLREFDRVAAKGGFISTPSGDRERSGPGAYHKWYIDDVDGVLNVIRKPTALPPPSPEAKSSARAKPETRYEWLKPDRPLRFVVHDSEVDDSSFVWAEFAVPDEVSFKGKRQLRRTILRVLRYLYRTRSEVGVPELLQCPVCAGTLARRADEVACVSGHRFPVVDDVPVLVREALFEDQP